MKTKKFFYVNEKEEFWLEYFRKTGQWAKTGEQAMVNSFNIHSYTYSQPSDLNKLAKQSSCFFTHAFQVSK